MSYDPEFDNDPEVEAELDELEAEAREGAADMVDEFDRDYVGEEYWDEPTGPYDEYDGTEGVDLAHEDLDPICTECDGTGEYPEGHLCKACNGKGRI